MDDNKEYNNNESTDKENYQINDAESEGIETSAPVDAGAEKTLDRPGAEPADNKVDNSHNTPVDGGHYVRAEYHNRQNQAPGQNPPSAVYPHGRYNSREHAGSYYHQDSYNGQYIRPDESSYPGSYHAQTGNTKDMGYNSQQAGFGRIAQPVDRRRNSGQGARVAGFIALFLAVAVIFSSVTGIVVYKLTSNALAGSQTQPSQTETTNNAQPTETQPTDSLPAEREGTDRHFNLEEAASRRDPGRKAKSTMEIAALGRPAVVAISTEMTMTDIFGQTDVVPAAGSGFIITEDGYIVTNNHVISGAETITVTMESGEVSEAILVGADPMNDIAVLKVDGENLPTVVLGSSEDLQIGELAVAIGNPLGRLSGTVTAGIISALDRSITIDGQTLNLLQTDAAINSGNSGGALFNSYGEVIGINTAKTAASGVEGLGFAIPIDNAKPIIESLIQYGFIRGRTKLGIYPTDITGQMAYYNQLPEGIYIREVERNSAADLAGLKKGDIIIKVDGREMITTSALMDYKNQKKPGDTISITIVRNDQELTVDLILEEDIPDDIRKTAVTD